MSPAEATVAVLLVVAVGTLTRKAARRQLGGTEAGEVADTPPASPPLTPLLGVVPPPRSELDLDHPATQL